jgi:hypothetical protein
VRPATGGRTGSTRALSFPKQCDDGRSNSKEDDEDRENLSHDGSSPEGWPDPVASGENDEAKGFRLEDGTAHHDGSLGVEGGSMKERGGSGDGGGHGGGGEGALMSATLIIVRNTQVEIKPLIHLKLPLAIGCTHHLSFLIKFGSYPILDQTPTVWS